jgi:hypothetical protein
MQHASTTHPLDVVSERVPLHDLLSLVPVYDGLETVKRPAAHHVPHALLLDAEPLDLVVDVEEEGVVAGRVVRGANQKTAGTTCSLDGIIIMFNGGFQCSANSICYSS